VTCVSLLFFVAASGLPAADADLLKIFPPGPSVPGLTFSGQLDYAATYSFSGASWRLGLDEREVFFAAMKHGEGTGTDWEIRIGKGGQLYSIWGPFGEAEPPQSQPNDHWVDQIFQLVGVDTHLNVDKPGHRYFIHQAGDYLDDPILKTTFYSPMLASNFNRVDRSASFLNWGQQAHIPNVNPAGLLYYERFKDLGSGVIEATYVVYNFGRDTVDYLSAPWGGVRKTSLPVTLMSAPDGSARVVSGMFGEPNLIDLKDTGGWIAWTQDATAASSPTLALVVGWDGNPRPDYQTAPARFNWGYAGPQYNFEVVDVDPFVKHTPGSAFYFRVYYVVGALAQVQNLANRLAPYAARGPLNFTQDSADLLPVYRKAQGGQTVLTASAPAGKTPAFYTYAEPVANSLPLFVLREASTGRLRLSTNPCEICTNIRSGNDTIVKPYDGTVGYVGFLGFVLPAEFIQSKRPTYDSLLDRVTDRSYLPETSVNRVLRVVTQKAKLPPGYVAPIQAQP